MTDFVSWLQSTEYDEEAEYDEELALPEEETKDGHNKGQSAQSQLIEAQKRAQQEQLKAAAIAADEEAERKKQLELENEKIDTVIA